jgi:hypothetical protein
MTIAIVANLSDGVVLGADSAITIQGRAELPGSVMEGVLKVYNDAEKVFHLANLNIGLVSYGIAMIGKRTIESYVREFEEEEKKTKGNLEAAALHDAADKLRQFMNRKYEEMFQGELENQFKMPYQDIPLKKKPMLGIVLAGYSPGDSLTEVWEVQVPYHREAADIKQVRPKGKFGTNWFGQYFGISRFVKGFDPALMNDVVGYFVENCGVKVDKQLEEGLGQVLAKHEYRMPFDAMPLIEGIDHVRFLLDMVINQHRYVIGAPVCGGNVRIAVVTKKGFKLLEPASRPYD